MKKPFTVMLVVGIVLGLIVLWHPWLPDGTIAHAQGKKKVTQWEYAELSVKYAVGTTGENPESQRLQFSSRELSVEESGWTAFAKKLGIKAESANRQLVLDHLGGQGWELAAVTAPTYSRGIQPTGVEFHWYFKRERQ
jgi:hypothetical protein